MSEAEEKEMEEAYKWIRTPAKGTDKIPTQFRWSIFLLLQDMDKRIQELKEHIQELEDKDAG